MRCFNICFPGFGGVATGFALLLAAFWFSYVRLTDGTYHLDPKGKEGAFEKGLLASYLDLAKFVLGLASGSIVLLVGSSIFNNGSASLIKFASPLFLLALSIIYGVLFMAFVLLDYEAYRHSSDHNTYTRFKYARNQAFGYGCLLCFCSGYAWLVVTVTNARL